MMTSELTDDEDSGQGMRASSDLEFHLLIWLRMQWDTMGGTGLSGETVLACVSMAIFPIINWLFLEPLGISWMFDVVSCLATLFCGVLVIVRAFWPLRSESQKRSSILPELLIATAYHGLWVAVLMITDACMVPGDEGR